jgi:hypothetical protein
MAASASSSGAVQRQVVDPHDDWLESVDVSHIKALDDSWKNHPFWADDEAFADSSTEAGKVLQEMSSGLTADERAESCKARHMAFCIDLQIHGETVDASQRMLSELCDTLARLRFKPAWYAEHWQRSSEGCIYQESDPASTPSPRQVHRRAEVSIRWRKQQRPTKSGSAQQLGSSPHAAGELAQCSQMCCGRHNF